VQKAEVRAAWGECVYDGGGRYQGAGERLQGVNE
jgi:hypothetical protein